MECWKLPNLLVDLLDTGDREEEEEEEDEFELDFDYFSESDDEWWSNNYWNPWKVKARQLRKITLACCLPRSVNQLVNELSGISLFTIPWIDLHINLWSQKQHDIS